ncbi:MAG: glutamine--fructose-6-phosphate aminotransferase [Candidatus Andersenbacteria bacterium RIFCSPHIGHO2_12_FULL_45_11]|uniref:Glutamine--fructose-6-phosphate aminotransferase [isomerizing] n=1 Tax=Candidatus Andersenbacteria bacterium RIFCSPHIGHO2_12_FULL_45_11 TaxID=1797281 RepID=A0A1G1WZW7_9BACT|nr:MAG: glutamine--fructose-6-phosphate aminotransferase [Candidatus Andersenbacteria bacterium RIFCSPHIGHO2_12_FULL_45_11]
MCGIVGYIGHKQASPVLLSGLATLEYRGYDSAGIAITQSTTLHIEKSVGRVATLQERLRLRPATGTCGISHTRWATHGGVTEENAHPHMSENREIAVVHNGVIENYAALKTQLQQEGVVFMSETDTEVLAHLISRELATREKSEDPLEEVFVQSVAAALHHIQGTYGIAVVWSRAPHMIVAARMASPLVLGIGKGEHFIASDASAIAPYTQEVIYLQDGDIAALFPDSYFIQTTTEPSSIRESETLAFGAEETKKGTYDHFMKKEIFEQPESIAAAMRGHIDPENLIPRFGGLNISEEELRNTKRIVFAACGSSWHAALFAEYIIEEFARIPVEVEYASELRYRNAPIEPNTLFFCISQSGETADTLAAMREYKRQGVPTLGIVNVVGSSIAREASGGMYLHAGPEIGVATTKAFTSQLVILLLFALHMARLPDRQAGLRGMPASRASEIFASLNNLPALIEQTLATEDAIAAVAQTIHTASTVLYLGRGYNFPIALEGALKLKEVSYIHAEGYPAAEIKHGPIALVDEHTPSIIINPKGPLYDKVMNTIQEIRARKGPVIAIASDSDTEIAKHVEHVLRIPDAPEYIQPILATIPIQLIGYHAAVLRGCDVDKPRNLAKSVTVE